MSERFIDSTPTRSRAASSVLRRRVLRHLRRSALAVKVVAVGMAVGGLWSALIVMVLADTPPAWLDRLVLWAVAIPLEVSMGTGLILFSAHPAVFVRLRWWQVMIGCGLASVFLTGAMLQRIVVSSESPTGLAAWALVAAIAATVSGRLKPRLGQDRVRLARALQGVSRSQRAGSESTSGEGA